LVSRTARLENVRTGNIEYTAARKAHCRASDLLMNLSLQGNFITDSRGSNLRGVTAISNGFRRDRLLAVNLRHCRLGGVQRTPCGYEGISSGDAVAALARSLSGTSHLTSLDLSCNYMCSAEAVHLTPLPSREGEGGKERGGGRGEEGGEERGQERGQESGKERGETAVETNRLAGLAELDRFDWRADPTLAAMRALCRALEEGCKGLRTLNLASNCVKQRSCALLAEALSSNGSLQSLDLTDNDQMGDRGVLLLAEGLRSNGSLRTINLQGGGVGPNGLQTVSACLNGEEEHGEGGGSSGFDGGGGGSSHSAAPPPSPLARPIHHRYSVPHALYSCTVLMHCTLPLYSHTLYSPTVLTHCTHPLYSPTVLSHCVGALSMVPLWS
jgi:hypothetical protein